MKKTADHITKAADHLTKAAEYLKSAADHMRIRQRVQQASGLPSSVQDKDTLASYMIVSADDYDTLAQDLNEEFGTKFTGPQIKKTAPTFGKLVTFVESNLDGGK